MLSRLIDRLLRQQPSFETHFSPAGNKPETNQPAERTAGKRWEQAIQMFQDTINRLEELFGSASRYLDLEKQAEIGKIIIQAKSALGEYKGKQSPHDDAALFELIDHLDHKSTELQLHEIINQLERLIKDKQAVEKSGNPALLEQLTLNDGVIAKLMTRTTKTVDYDWNPRPDRIEYLIKIILPEHTRCSNPRDKS